MCTSAGLSIGHAEYIVSLNSTVNTAVARDGSAKFGCFVAGDIHSVKHTERVLIVFNMFIVCGIGSKVYLFTLCLLLYFSVCVDTKEVVDGCRWNWLLFFKSP